MSQSQNLTYLHDAIARYQAAGATPEMESFLRSIMHAESGGSCTAKNKSSSATGLFQFVKGTWEKVGNGCSITDPQAQCDAVVRFAIENGKVLRAVLHHEPDAGQYYLAHFAGAEGARKILSADPSTPIRQLLSAGAIHANSKRENGKQGISFHGKDFADFTAQDLQQWSAERMGASLYEARAEDGVSADDPAQKDFGKKLLMSIFGLSTEQADNFCRLPMFGQILIGMLNLFLKQTAPAETASDHQQTQIAAADMNSVQRPQVPTKPRAPAVLSHA